MKNIKNICSIALMGTALTFSACNDWLSLDPENSVTAKQYWKSESDVSAAMAGIYCSIADGTTSLMFNHGEMRADFLIEGRSVQTYHSDVRQGNITSSNKLVAWTNYYKVINNCNLLIAKADEALANDASFTVSDCEMYKAQARVIRDFMYFYLIRVYKDVPYITEPYYDDTKERNVAPTSQTEILDAIIADLEELEKAYVTLPGGAQNPVLPYSYSVNVAAENKGQVNMYTLKTILADMYRWQGSLATEPQKATQAYQNCVNRCDEIISSGQFALIPVEKNDARTTSLVTLDDAVLKTDSCFYVVDDYAAADWFDQVYVKGNSAESIFEIQADDYTACSGLYNLLASTSWQVAPNKAHIEDDVFLPTQNEFATRGNYEDVRLRMNMRGLGDTKYCWKYAGTAFDGENYTVASDYKRNFYVYRLPEVYLMKAEALVQLAWSNGEDSNMLKEAYMAVFKVRDRASAVETTDVTLGNGKSVQVEYWDELMAGKDIELDATHTLSCLDMEKFVLEEEGRELMFEGKRWFDIIRNAARNSYGKGNCTGGNLNYLLDIVVNATTVDKVTYLRNAYLNEQSHYLPYPYDDVKLNELLSQKPFYGAE